MKRLFAIACLIATAANAQMWTNVITGAVAAQPSRRQADAVGAPADWFILPGWQPFSLEQQAAWDAKEAAKAEAAAAAAAQYADVSPANYAPRVLHSLTNKVGDSQLFVDAETGEVFAVDETGSPEHTQAQKEAQQAARKAARAAAAAAIDAAAKNGKVNERLDAIEAGLKSLLK
jgi:hypothetical protein